MHTPIVNPIPRNTTRRQRVEKKHDGKTQTEVWRQSSVVMTSVFDWQTFPDLCPISGLQVTTTCLVSAMGQSTKPTRPSVPSGSVNE